MDVAREDKIGARVGQRREDLRPPEDRSLGRAPRRRAEVVVQDDHAERIGKAAGELTGHAAKLGAGDDAFLVEPAAHRVDAHDAKAIGAVRGLRLGPDRLERLERAQQAGGREHRDVVVPGHGQHRGAERAQKDGRLPVLVGGGCDA